MGVMLRCGRVVTRQTRSPVVGFEGFTWLDVPRGGTYKSELFIPGNTQPVGQFCPH